MSETGITKREAWESVMEWLDEDVHPAVNYNTYCRIKDLMDEIEPPEPDEHSFETITANVRSWSFNRGLHKADPARQMLKLTEEIGELAAAIIRNKKGDIVDALGDVVVVLTILCQQFDLGLTGCFWEAYQVIKDRTGKTVNGVYVKSEDIRQEGQV